MVLREMMLDSMQIMPLPAISTAPVQDKSAGKPAFSEIFNSVKTNEKIDSVPKTDSTGLKQMEQNDSPDSRPAVKTFREVQSAARHEAVKNTSAEKPAAVDSTEDDKAKVDSGNDKDNSALERIVNCFAQVLGISPGEFKQLLKAADISPEELTNITNVQELASKLSNILGLNQEEGKTLETVLGMVNNQVQALIKSGDFGDVAPEATGTASGETASLVEGSENLPVSEKLPVIEVIRQQSNPVSEFNALLAKLKLRLNELQQKLGSESEGLANEISLKVKDILGNEGDTSKVTADAQTAATPDGAEVKNVSDKTDDNQNMSDPKENKSDRKSGVEGLKNPPAAAAGGANNDQTPVTLPVTAQVQKAGETVPADRINAKTPVEPRDIINQVLEKAKVVLTGDKSEMVMDLKPDSLGKLSLKVVTEHGIVMAKFIADNQQVKQVLESNMQLLKDSLEKQGMNVQGFSVSVRQDSRQGNTAQYDSNPSGRTSPQKTAYGVERLSISADRLEALERRNPYSLETSTVNFTA